jgi:PAS domain S-box-containing protein
VNKKRNPERISPLEKSARRRTPSGRPGTESLSDLPIPLWEEDFSAAKIRLDALRAAGVTDWRAHLEGHPEEVHSCLSLLRVRAVNAAALALFQYDRKATFLKNPPLPLEKAWRNVMREELIALAEGRRGYESDLEMKTFDGEPLSIRRRVWLAPGSEGDWSRVIVAPLDITKYKKAESRLLTEVEWGSFLLDLYEISSRLTESELLDHVLEQAVHFTDSRVGFYHVLSADRTTASLTSWIGPPAEGSADGTPVTIPLEQAGRWADCVRSKRPVVSRNNPPRRSMAGLPAGHPPIHRFLSVPVLGENDVECVFSVANKGSAYETRDLVHIQLVAYGLHRILKQRRAVEALSQSEELFRLLTKHFPVPIAVFHEHGRVEFLNDRFLSLFGYSLAEIPDLDSFWQRLLPEEGYRREIVEAWRQAQDAADRDLTDAELKDCRLQSFGGPERTVDVLGARFHTRRLLLLNDVTEHKRAEAETRLRTEELEVLAKISTAMRAAQSRFEIYTVLVEQLSVLMKAKGAVLALRDPESGDNIVELGSHHWKDLTGYHLLANGEQLGGVLPAGNWSWRKNGRPGPERADLQAIHELTSIAYAPLIAGGQVIGTIWIGRASPIADHDIRLLTAIGEMAASAIQRQSLHEDLQIQLNALRQTQARLVQSEKLAAIGQLAAGIAHELNNPLTSVVLYSQLIQQEKLDGAVQSNLEKVVAEALRAGKIVRGLLDFARQRPIHREAVQVNEALRNSLDLISYDIEAGGIKVELQLSSGLPAITADLYQLTQVFINLIQNSLQAMRSESGWKVLTIITETGPSIYSTPNADGRTMVRIAFKDTGPGITGEILTRIFDPFFTTKAEGGGTGLGLSICHGIVSEHEGHIWAESTVGQGTTFIVELPVTSKEEEKHSRREDRSSAESTGRQSRVLILDDEPNVQDVLAKTLTRRGYMVDTVGNGEDGLARLSKNEYDVILCDFRMPGFSGMDFYRRIQSEKPHLASKIVFITGDTANLVTRRFIEENDLTILEKPFEIPDLIQAIRLVNEKAPG